MFSFAAVALRNIAGEQDHNRMKGGTRQIAHPAIRCAVTRHAENRRPSGHAVTEFLRKRRERPVVDTERVQSGTGECNRDPACVG